MTTPAPMSAPPMAFDLTSEKDEAVDWFTRFGSDLNYCGNTAECSPENIVSNRHRVYSQLQLDDVRKHLTNSCVRPMPYANFSPAHLKLRPNSAVQIYYYHYHHHYYYY